MRDFLFFTERMKISEKFITWCEETGAEQRVINLLAWLDENDALNLDKCRAIIGDKKAEPVTDSLTVETVKQVLNITKEQRDALQKISEGIDSCISLWGTFGRLIDRDTVMGTLRALKKDAEIPLSNTISDIVEGRGLKPLPSTHKEDKK